MFELELVINTEFGGFSLSDEMASWLVENRNWTLVTNKEYNYKKQYPLETLLIACKDMNVHPNDNSNIEFRSHKDLLDCVRHFKIVHENDKYPDSYYGHIHELEIEKFKVRVEIEEYHDGKERVICDMVSV